MIPRGVPFGLLLAALAIASAAAGDENGAAPTATVRVKVVLQGTAPRALPGARVVIRGADTAAPSASGRTGADGIVTFAFPLRNDATDWVVEASGGGAGLATTRLHLPAASVATAAEPAPDRLATVVVGRGAPVAGTVTDAVTGRPVICAQIHVDCSDVDGRAETDAAGAFAFEGLGDDELIVVAPGYVPVSHFVAAKRGGAMPPLRVRLERAGTVRGKVVSVRGFPAANEHVALRGERTIWTADGGVCDDEALSRAAARTGPDGTFELSCAPFGLRYQIVLGPFSGPRGFSAALRSIAPARGVLVSTESPVAEVKVTPDEQLARPAVSLVVDVDAPDAAPGSVETELSVPDEDWHASADRDEPLVHRGVPPGRYRLRVSAPRFPVWYGDVEVAPGDEPTRVRVAPQGKDAIEGRVVDESGAPVQGVVIRWRPWDRARDVGMASADDITDMLGRFRVARLTPGPYRIAAAASVWAEPPCVDVTAPARGVVLVAPRTGTVEALPARIDGVARWTRAWCADGMAGMQDGRLRITHVPVGRRRLVVQLAAREGGRSECLPLVLEVDVKAGATTDAGAVTPDAGTALAGIVVGLDGAPAAGVLVASGDAETTSDDDGRFELRPLPRANVVVTAERGSRRADVAVNVAAPPERFEIRLAELRAVRVETGVPNGMSARGWFAVDAIRPGEAGAVSVRRALTFDGARMHGVVDARGVTFLMLPPGDWTLRATADVAASPLATVDVTVPATGDGPVRVALPVR